MPHESLDQTDDFVTLFDPSRKAANTMQKGHKGLLKRIKVTGTGKVRFHSPNSRHLKSNKKGTTVQSYRKSRYLGATDLIALSKMLGRSLRTAKRPAATGGKD